MLTYKQKPPQKSAKSFLSIRIDAEQKALVVQAAEREGLQLSPVLPVPINAALFPDKENAGTFNLIWNRQDEQKDLKAEATVNVHVQPQHQTKTQTRRSNGPTLAL